MPEGLDYGSPAVSISESRGLSVQETHANRQWENYMAFQSRNREAYLFKSDVRNLHPTFTNKVSISESRGLSAQEPPRRSLYPRALIYNNSISDEFANAQSGRKYVTN